VTVPDAVPDARGPHPSARPLATPGPILIVVGIGALAAIATLASIVRQPTVPAVISEDYSRVAARLLLPEVRDADPSRLARALTGRQGSLVVRLPSLSDAGYILEGGAIRTMLGRPGVVAIYHNRALDLVVAHAYQGALSELPGPPEIRQTEHRHLVLHRKATNILVFWQVGPTVMVITSSLPVEQVVRLAVTAARSVGSTGGAGQDRSDPKDPRDRGPGFIGWRRSGGPVRTGLRRTLRRRDSAR
jgi:hypothetical protein